jgi:homoserine kinase type II
MSAVMPLNENFLEATVADYDIGRLEDFWLATNGIENSNYFVRTQQGDRQREYVLTIMEQPPNAGAAYPDMLANLNQDGLPVAPPLRTRSGEPAQPIEGKAVMLQRRLPGQHTCNPTTRQICALARFTARMHLSMQGRKLELPDHPRNVSWLASQINVLRGHLPYADQRLIEDVITKTASLLRRRDVQALPRGMIHGDLFRDNVLFNEQGLTGVIDFHHAANGHWIYDLAVAANDWCNDAGGAMNSERLTSLLKAYHAVRPITSQELWFFSAFALYAAVSFWLSRLTAALTDRPGEVRNKDPDEFKRIVEHHSRHPFYIDPRSLTV